MPEVQITIYDFVIALKICSFLLDFVIFTMVKIVVVDKLFEFYSSLF